jgi:thymidine phosphorylase
MTDMDEPLASAAGNAVEVMNAVRYLRGDHRDRRLHEVTLALGGPADLAERPGVHLPAAPAQQVVRAACAGWVGGMATREIGLLVVELGGGRRSASDRVDHRVGLTDVAPIGARVDVGDPLALVHAADEASAEAAAARLSALFQLVDEAPAARPVIVERIVAEGAA